MNRSTLARRYAPLAALAVVQLLIITFVPSKAHETQVDTGPAAIGSGDGTGAGATTEDTIAADGAVDPATGQPTAGAGTAAGGTGTRTGSAAGGAAAGGAAAGGAAAGGGGTAAASGGSGITADTSHCVDGRQFDPKIYYYAPKCVGKWKDGANNGGATYQGVTDKEVKVIVYRGKPNPAVDAILDAIGSNPPDPWVTDFLTKSVGVINSKMEFYGRKLVVKEINGTCDTVPPNYTCLRGEMRDIVRSEKPFLVLWPTILASPAFDELSALKVINVGGQHFRNSFSIQRRPYHWDATIPGDVAAKHVAEWYCKRLHGKKAAWAGTTGADDPRSQNPPTDDIRNKTRVLGVISTDDPENQNNIRQVLKPELAKCGAQVSHEFYYAQDIARAEEQRRVGIAKMRENPESTSIMCFCDGVAPLFLYRTAQEQNYFPEHIVVGVGSNDTDAVGQSYDFGSSLCPDCHQYENAFGLRSVGALERFTNNAATRLYKANGGTLIDNFDKYKGAIGDLDYLMLVGSLIQGAGPNLIPANIEKGAFAAGARGGFPDTPTDPHFSRRGFKPGNYGWITDMDQVFWSQKVTSESQGGTKLGAYVQVDGRRFDQGEYPDGDMNIPQGKPR
jgi:hypothetical protein